jgi:hypothetical protein
LSIAYFLLRSCGRSTVTRFDCIAISSVYVAVALHLTGQQEVYAVASVSVLLQWTKMLYYLQPFPQTGLLVCVCELVRACLYYSQHHCHYDDGFGDSIDADAS